MIGIYKIENSINNKVYIGQSTNIEKRFAQHKSPYEQERFSDKPLYKAFSKYGIQNFNFEVLEECDIEKLNEKECYWIKKYNSLCHEFGYNIRSGGECNAGEDHPNHKLTKEDVIDIRTRYANHERKKDVEALYYHKIGSSGFSKVWKGETWKGILDEVYTSENKNFHKHNTGQCGSKNGRAKLTEDEVKAIRLRKQNGESLKNVFQDYIYTGITKRAFESVWEYKNWKNVQI